jgi:pyridoxine 5-phosphate synthase
MKLGVNIDHIATLRQARRSDEPDPIFAAMLAELGGADGITVHLRLDRRHIQDRDLEMLSNTVKTRLNLEMSLSMEMVKIALKNKPQTCTLVAENVDEITTNGGLDVMLNSDRITEVASNLKAAGIEVSLFIDPNPDQIKATHRLGMKVIELNTAAYSDTYKTSASAVEFEKLQKAATYAGKLGIKVLAGHGLNYRNVQAIKAIPEIVELNIGHSIVAMAAMVGMKEAVQKMKSLL